MSNTSTPTRAGFTIRNWRPYSGDSRTLLGFFSLVLESGMVLNDCRLQKSKEGQPFIGLPQRQYEDNGETKYARNIDFVDRETNDRFQKLALDAFRRAHPEVRI